MPNNGGMEQISPIDKAAQLLGGMATLARMLGVSPPTVHEWKTHRRPVPAARCMSIVQMTKGAVTVKELRPDDWQKYWPELAQSPEIIAQDATKTVGQGV